MSLFQPLQESLQSYLSEQDIQRVFEAFSEAQKAHTGQKRHSGEDYITHPVAVAHILANMHMDTETIMAALLHDVIEDTALDKPTLIKKFGEDVAELVDGATKLTQIKFENRAEAQAENFRKMLMAMARDIRVIIIKLADRLHNMRTLGVLRPEKKHRIARETLDIYAPIANRLGMHNFFIEFEDLGFAALYPNRYRILKEHVRRIRGNRKEIIQKIEQEITNSLNGHQLGFQTIHGREKHLYSIYKKMRSKSIPFSEIMDVYAVRVIVDTVDECYRVLGVVHQLYKPVPGRFKDYIAIPKVNSYQSLHTTLFGPYGLPVEVQIRTLEMDKIAETGIAAHWLYKTPTQNPDTAQLRAREWLKTLIEMQAQTKSPLEFIENVKTDLMPDDVYVFTPKGDIMELPSGATAVDFAYSVHTDIGNHCIAAKINRRLMPLSTILVNGQTIEVITAPGARPNPSWINFVKTSRARSKIKEFLKNQKRTEAIELGKKLLNKHLSWFSLSLARLSKDNILKAAERFTCKTRKGLYSRIGMGNLLPMVVARTLAAIHLKRDDLLEENNQEHSSKPMMIKGSQGMVLNLASCCRPIPDDPIIGIFNPGQGLMIHACLCKEIRKILEHPDRYIELQWEEHIAGDFKVELTIDILNEKGTLAKIASQIANSDADIGDISMGNQEGQFITIHLLVGVKNRVHLAKIIRRVRQIKEVVKISRY